MTSSPSFASPIIRSLGRGPLAGLVLLLLSCGCGSALALEFHVSPTGSDTNAGTAAAPFATPEKARDAVRATARGSTQAIIWLHGGDYLRSSSFTLTSQDNNSIYKAVPDETPRFIGGVKLDPTWFTTVTSASPIWSRLDATAQGNVMEVDLAARGITNYGTLLPRGFNMSNTGAMELLVNDKPQRLARWPNAGSWATIATAPSNTTFTYSGTRPSRWNQAEEAWIHAYFYHNWADYAVKTTTINTATKTITVPATSYGIRAGQPYFAFNLLEEIDTPGEYYINRDTGMLYYWPPSGFSNADVIATVMTTDLFSVSGASDITVEGIEFVGARGRLAQITNGTNVVYQRCKFLASGTNAISVSGGTNSGIYDCEIADTGAGGVSLTGGDRATLTPSGNFARQSLIHDLSRLSFTYNPGVRMSGVGQIAEHCEIFNNFHAAITFGGNEHRIEYNKIHNVCTTSNDAGAIYCGRDWGLRGNLIRYNFIHDIKSTLIGTHDVHAVYLDDCSSGITVFGNVFYRVSGRALFNAGGRDNVWVNNVVAKSGTFHRGDTRGVTSIDNTPGSSWNLLERINALNYKNPPWSTAYPALAAIPNNYSQLGPYKYPGGVVLSRNVSWQNTNHISTSGSATDYYAEVANNISGQDPRFVNEAALDLTLRADSPALAIPGFVPIPFKEMGRTIGQVPNQPPLVNAGEDQIMNIVRGNPVPQTPADLGSSLAAWYDSADASTITASPGLVSQWNDKSGNGKHLTQGTSTKRPTTGTRTLNGLNVLDFDGGDVLLNTSFAHSSLNVSYVQVFKSDTTGSGIGTFIGFGRTNASEGYIRNESGSETLRGYGHRFPEQGEVYFNQNTNPHIVSYVKSGTSSQEAWQDGTKGTERTTAMTTFTSQRLSIGGRMDEVSTADGFVAETLILSSSLSEADRHMLEGYLAHKWGMATNLPAAHPFKSAAPTKSGDSAVVTLIGTAGDPENDPFTTSWTVVTKPSGSIVTFGNASSPSTTATFSAPGDYTLRLTADDGTPVSDEVLIRVVDTQASYQQWLEGASLDEEADVTFGGDANGDGIANGMSWLLGSANPQQNGHEFLPQIERNEGGLSLSFKMLNSARRGTAILNLQYSSDLGITDPWSNNTIQVPDDNSRFGEVEFEITPIEGTDHNQVHVTIPALTVGDGGKFFARLQGMFEP